jgi:periplasmic divalent cation tolerance protein
MSDETLVVLSTTGSVEEATTIARHLVQEHLAASVNVLPGARSIFVWDGRLQDTTEAVLLIKTRRERYAQLERRIHDLHSYSVPGIVAVPVVSGSPAYTGWIRDALMFAEGGER